MEKGLRKEREEIEGKNNQPAINGTEADSYAYV